MARPIFNQNFRSFWPTVPEIVGGGVYSPPPMLCVSFGTPCSLGASASCSLFVAPRRWSLFCWTASRGSWRSSSLCTQLINSKTSLTALSDESLTHFRCSQKSLNLLNCARNFQDAESTFNQIRSSGVFRSNKENINQEFGPTNSDNPVWRKLGSRTSKSLKWTQLSNASNCLASECLAAF